MRLVVSQCQFPNGLIARAALHLKAVDDEEEPE